MAATENARKLALVAAQAAADKKATDVVLLDVSEQLVITDCFMIASADNERQVEAIDFVDVVVHVQHSEERAFYQLERLWKDCPRIEFADADRPVEQQDAEE